MNGSGFGINPGSSSSHEEGIQASTKQPSRGDDVDEHSVTITSGVLTGKTVLQIFSRSKSNS